MRTHPKFISKKELGRGFPSVSYNLRVGGSALIERKNPRQALAAKMVQTTLKLINGQWLYFQKEPEAELELLSHFKRRVNCFI